MPFRIGFIGVGSMGAALAGRLVDHHTLHVFDLNRAAAEGLVERGAVFNSPKEIASTCEFVFLSLPGPADVEKLLLGEDGIVGDLAAGSVLIDTTTSSPGLDAVIMSTLIARGVEFVDAGVAGGVRAVREGTGTLMVGASPDAFARVEEVLGQITTKVFHVGGVGTGHTMKLVNNLLGYCNRFAALECVHIAEESGIQRDMVIKVLNQSSGRNFTTESTYVNLWDGATWNPMGFTLDLVRKDMRLATELATSHDCVTPIGSMVQGFVDTAIERFGPKADQVKIMESWWED
jgi:3-hydroxyisobutyrate dehydrogenase-like beta-hydroxyacid dehydrogenase